MRVASNLGSADSIEIKNLSSDAFSKRVEPKMGWFQRGSRQKPMMLKIVAKAEKRIDISKMTGT